MRVLVTGNAGAGKTTVSTALAEGLGLPRYNLDGVVWRERWHKAPATERDAAVAQLIDDPSWVIDGVSEPVLRAADVVVFLDVPRRRCIGRAMRRNRRYLFRSRPELPPRCPEILIIPRLLRIIWRFDANVRPQILAELRRRGPEAAFHVRSATDLVDVRAQLERRRLRYP